jgi:hypothetical protein
MNSMGWQAGWLVAAHRVLPPGGTAQRERASLWRSRAPVIIIWCLETETCSRFYLLSFIFY